MSFARKTHSLNLVSLSMVISMFRSISVTVRYCNSCCPSGARRSLLEARLIVKMQLDKVLCLSDSAWNRDLLQ